MTNGMKKSVGQSVSRYLCQVFSVYIYDTDLCDQHLNDQWNDEVNQSVSLSVHVQGILSIHI